MTYAALLDQVKAYDPSRYHNTRNYTNGAVSAWSPYISRGFLSPILVMDTLKSKYSKQAWIGLMQQMAWREYFQRVWQNKGDLILQDLKTPQTNCILKDTPDVIMQATTGIVAIDDGIRQLYKQGYLHNHLRMYISMLHTNIFRTAWLPGARWMYAHLLDHDPAANFLSWQWVAGTSSSKQYVANQDNINKYTNTKQVNTFLDIEYEYLPEAIFNKAGHPQPQHSKNFIVSNDSIDTINTLQILDQLESNQIIQKFDLDKFDSSLPFCIYNSFNLDPLWHASEKANRVLLLEPNHYAKFPIAENVLQFIIDLAQKNIAGLQVFIGNFETLVQVLESKNTKASVTNNAVSPVIYFKEHPTASHYQGVQEPRDWLFTEVTGYYPSFFGYWKKCERFLK